MSWVYLIIFCRTEVEMAALAGLAYKGEPESDKFEKLYAYYRIHTEQHCLNNQTGDLTRIFWAALRGGTNSQISPKISYDPQKKFTAVKEMFEVIGPLIEISLQQANPELIPLYHEHKNQLIAQYDEQNLSASSA
jgi:hypothetical protein